MTPLKGTSMDKRASDQKKIDALREQKKALDRPNTRKRKPRGEFTGKDKEVYRE
jgi:hypothetical protein